MKLAVFKPYNARPNNAFDSGQYPIFKKLQDENICEVTFFLDDESVKFEGVQNRYIKVNKCITFINKVLRKIFKIKYIKIPYYGNIDFNEYDIIMTEGFHYPFLKYFEDFHGKLIINDTITAENRISKLDSDYINKKFSNAKIIVVNGKIPLLFNKYNIDLECEVIGHALQLDKIPFKERKKFNGKILSIGRFVKEKGYIYIFKAMKKLVKKYPNITLDIYGSGPLKDDLYKYIIKNNLENNIDFKGFIAYDELLSKLNEYDLFISHPLEMNYIAEAFHMGNMEAMANGMPLITTDCGGVPYIVKDKAFVGKQYDVEYIIDKISLLIEKTDLLNKMSLNGRKFIENEYGLDVIYNKWKKLIIE